MVSRRVRAELMKKLIGVSAGLFLLLGCATGSNVVDLSQRIDLSMMHGLREEVFPEVGEWRVVSDGITNAIPFDASPQDVARSTEGVGVSLAVLNNFEARDLAMEARVSFLATGCPCLVFRVREEEGIARSMYSLALNGQGINLWCLQNGQWALVRKMTFSVSSHVPYLLSVKAKGDKIAVALDGNEFFEVRDKTLTAPGGAGICAREGPCLFQTLKVKGFD